MNLKLLQLPSTMVERSYYIPVFCLVLLFVSGLTVATSSRHNREVHHQKDVEVEGIKSITLKCDTNYDITGKNLDHVTWWKKINGTKDLVATRGCTSELCEHNYRDDRIDLQLNQTSGSAMLVISKVHPSDYGNYVCVFATMDGIDMNNVKLIIKPPVDISCSDCVFDRPDQVIVEEGTEVELWCSTQDGFNTSILLNDSGLSNIKEKNSSMIRFVPTLDDEGKQIECVVESEKRNQRNLTLRVKGSESTTSTVNKPTTSTVNKPTASTENGGMNRMKTTTSSPSISKGGYLGQNSNQRVCFYAGVYGDEGTFRQLAECQEPKTGIILPNDLKNDIGIVCCTDDDCTDPIKVIQQEDSDNFTLTTYLCISLFVIIGMAFLLIVIVLVWKKRRDGLRIQVNYNDYASPYSDQLHRPRPPVSECYTTSIYPSSSHYTSSTMADDDELQELSSTWEDDVSLGGKRQSLKRSLSARARRSFRDSTVVYGNVPFVTILDRVKTVGFSYF